MVCCVQQRCQGLAARSTLQAVGCNTRSRVGLRIDTEKLGSQGGSETHVSSVVCYADVRKHAPWALMGRVTQSGEFLENNPNIKVRLKLDIAAKDLQLFEREIMQRYQALLSLLPEFEERLVQLPQAQVAELLADVSTVAARMIELKRLLPYCDVDAIVTWAPKLLLDEDWPIVVAAVQQLRALYASEDDISALAQQNPIILQQDVEYVVSELQRLYKYKTPADAARHLRARPDVVFLLEKGLRGIGPSTY